MFKENSLFKYKNFLSNLIAACNNLDELLNLWRLVHRCEDDTSYISGSVPQEAFLPDGIINELSYQQSGRKILYIAKEANWYEPDNNKEANEASAANEIFWHREVAYGRASETGFSKRLAMMTNAIVNNDYTNINKEHKALRSVAVINLNKRGGFVSCEGNTLEGYVQRYWEFIQREIELIAPDLIICCGAEVRDLLNKYVPIADNVQIAAVKHPSYFAVTDADYLKQLQKAMEGRKFNVQEQKQETVIDSQNEKVNTEKVAVAVKINMIKDNGSCLKLRSTGTTMEFNLRENLYYDCLDKGFAPHAYIGLYKDKGMRAIGKICAVITAVVKSTGIEFKSERGELTQARKDAICKAIEDGKRYGYELNEYRYFFVEKFFPTEFLKASSGPMRSSRNFDLKEILGLDVLPSTEEIAALLRGKTWE